MVNHTERSSMEFSDDAVINLYNAVYTLAIDEYIIAEIKLESLTDVGLKHFYEHQLKDSKRFIFKDNPMGYDEQFLKKIIKARKEILYEKEKSRKTKGQSDNKGIQTENSREAE